MDQVAYGPGRLHEIREREDVGSLRRQVRGLALELGASEPECGRVELAATELATNALFHGGSSAYVLFQPVQRAAGVGLELLAIDRGPGIRDVGAVLRPPSDEEIEANLASGRRGLGCGLSSVQRLASAFDVHSELGKGTVVLARFLFGQPDWAAPGPAPGLQCAGISVPMVKDDYNGDAWTFVQQGPHGSLLVMDGLGHGRSAAEAAQTGLAEFRRAYDGDIAAYFERAHGAMRGTRGAAVMLCRVDCLAGTILYGGVGNVEGRIHSRGRGGALTPQNGTLGMHLAIPRIVVREIPWAAGDTLIVHSDGIRGPLDLSDHGTLGKHDPAVIAAVLHRDHARGRDDATVVVVRDMRGDQGEAGAG